MSPQKICESVATPSFPTYAITAVSGRYAVVGGGGGAAKTGIHNKFDVYELYHTGKQTSAERVVSHDVGDECISNMTGWCPASPTSKVKGSSNIMLAVGQEENCVLFRLKPQLASYNPDAGIEEIPVKEDANDENSQNNVRYRGKEKDRPIPKSVEEARRLAARKRKDSINNTLRGKTYFSFSVQEISRTETVFRKKGVADDVYQKVVRVSSDHKLLATGGTDGHIRIWALPDMARVRDIAAHEADADDIDFRPDNKQIVSVSKPTRECSIWNTSDGKKFIQLSLQTNGVKYKFYKARYGTVEGDMTNLKLFTISNAVVGSKHPGIIAKWDTKSYMQEKTQSVRGSLSSLAISENGRYLATGTMEGGVYIIISFSLQVLRFIEDAHNHFITGLEWLPINCPTSRMSRGFSEASVLSISCDNSVKIHHVPRPGMMPVWLVAVLAAVVLFGAFFLASFLGL